MGHHTLLIVALCTQLYACAKNGSDDSSNISQSDRSDDGDLLSLDPDTAEPSGGGVLGDCNTITTKINGTLGDEAPDPTVGDEWIVRMYCDGALLTGANRLYFVPAEVAHVDDYNTDVKFVAAGDTTMTMQAGNLVYTKDITVTANK